MLRKATEMDLAELITLYCAAHQSTRTEAAAWLQDIVGFENLLLLEKAPVRSEDPPFGAMLGTVPAKYGYRHGVWLTEATVRPDLCGKGLEAKLESSLLRAFAQRGADFVVAVPQDAQAMALYEELGFQKAFPLRVVQKPIARNLLAQADFDTMTVRRLQETRLRYFPGCVELPERDMAGIVARLYRQGITIVSSTRGYGLYYTDGDILQFIELQAANDHAADVLLQAAREKTGATQAKLLLSENQVLYLGEGKRCGYGMIHFLNKAFPLADMYFRLLL